MEYRLVVTAGGMNEVYPLKEGINIIGRDSDNDIQLISPNVSRHHAKIFITADGIAEIEDLNSSNGTYVNGKRITRIQLRHGNEIRIGRIYFLFEEASAHGLDESGQSRDYSTRVRSETIKTKLNPQDAGGTEQQPAGMPKPVKPLKPLRPKQ